MTITVQDVKDHVIIDDSDDDTLLEGFLAAALVHAERYLRRDFAVEYPDELPAPIRIAILQHIAAMYRDREATLKDSRGTPPLGYFDLLSTYRVFS
jgi:hypothetical protein